MAQDRKKVVVFEKQRSQWGWNTVNEEEYWRKVPERQEEPGPVGPWKDRLMELGLFFF